MLASGINDDTASVNSGTGEYYGVGNRPTGNGGSSLAPPTGMYFFHPDHLGNITMVTDGRGNVVANSSGKSHISYKPYGEIYRTDSSGPDVSKFKYTGQEEDKESGLLYYKARYYDPVIGRFLQADSVIMPESTFGMNRYMYVEGNPVNYRDPSGHAKGGNFFSKLGKNMMGGAQWASGGLARAGDTYNTFTGNRKYKGKDDFKRSDIKKGIDYTWHKLFVKFDRWWDRTFQSQKTNFKTETGEGQALHIAWWMLLKECDRFADQKENSACKSRVNQFAALFVMRAEANYYSTANAFQIVPGFKISLGKGDGNCSQSFKVGSSLAYSYYQGRNRYYGPINPENNPGQFTPSPDPINDSSDRTVTDFSGAYASQEAMCNYGADNDR